MKTKKYRKTVLFFLFFTLLSLDRCFAEAADTEEPKPEEQFQEDQNIPAESEMPEETSEYQEGLLDKILSRDKAAPPAESPEMKHKTFEETMQEEKEKQRLEDIGKERERENDPLRRLVY